MLGRRCLLVFAYAWSSCNHPAQMRGPQNPPGHQLWATNPMVTTTYLQDLVRWDRHILICLSHCYLVVLLQYPNDSQLIRYRYDLLTVILYPASPSRPKVISVWWSCSYVSSFFPSLLSIYPSYPSTRPSIHPSQCAMYLFILFWHWVAQHSRATGRHHR